MRVEFLNTDGQRLAGRLERPAEEPFAWAIFAHCFTCSKDVHAATRISRAFEQCLARLQSDEEQTPCTSASA